MTADKDYLLCTDVGGVEYASRSSSSWQLDDDLARSFKTSVQMYNLPQLILNEVGQVELTQIWFVGEYPLEDKRCNKLVGDCNILKLHSCLQGKLLT